MEPKGCSARIADRGVSLGWLPMPLVEGDQFASRRIKVDRRRADQFARLYPSYASRRSEHHAQSCKTSTRRLRKSRTYLRSAASRFFGATGQMIGSRLGRNRPVRQADSLPWQFDLLLSRLALLEVRRLSRRACRVLAATACAARGLHCGEGACGEKNRGGATRDGGANPKVIAADRYARGARCDRCRARDRCRWSLRLRSPIGWPSMLTVARLPGLRHSCVPFSGLIDAGVRSCRTHLVRCVLKENKVDKPCGMLA